MPRPLSSTRTPPSASRVTHDPVAVPGQRLVDGVVDDLADQVVQTALTGGPDVHTGALADRVEPFEHLDRARVVFAARRRSTGSVGSVVLLLRHALRLAADVLGGRCFVDLGRLVGHRLLSSSDPAFARHRGPVTHSGSRPYSVVRGAARSTRPFYPSTEAEPATRRPKLTSGRLFSLLAMSPLAGGGPESAHGHSVAFGRFTTDPVRRRRVRTGPDRPARTRRPLGSLPWRVSTTSSTP